jgi:hypothetical protein
MVHLAWVVLERATVAAAELDHPPPQASTDAAPELARHEVGLAKLSSFEIPREARLLGAVERRVCRQRPISSMR